MKNVMQNNKLKLAFNGIHTAKAGLYFEIKFKIILKYIAYSSL